MNNIVLLNGTPASGKDSVSSYLVGMDQGFVHFKKHKINNSGKLDDSYILINKPEFDKMVKTKQFIQYHYRYNRGYGVSKKELEINLDKGLVPIIHVGKYENIFQFFNLKNVNVISILLLTSEKETKRRLVERHGKDIKEINSRIAAYKEERREISKRICRGENLKFDFIIENTNLSVKDTSEIIAKIVYPKKK